MVAVNFRPGKGLKLPNFRAGNMLTVFGIVMLTLLLYVLIMSIITTVTGSVWLTKVASRPLKDTYDVIVYNDGGSALEIRGMAVNESSLSPEQIDDALENLPAVIFPDMKPSDAQRILEKVRELGGIAGIN